MRLVNFGGVSLKNTLTQRQDQKEIRVVILFALIHTAALARCKKLILLYNRFNGLVVT
jgi:hypothetical protein